MLHLAGMGFGQRGRSGSFQHAAGAAGRAAARTGGDTFLLRASGAATSPDLARCHHLAATMARLVQFLAAAVGAAGQPQHGHRQPKHGQPHAQQTPNDVGGSTHGGGRPEHGQQHGHRSLSVVGILPFFLHRYRSILRGFGKSSLCFSPRRTRPETVCCGTTGLTGLGKTFFLQAIGRFTSPGRRPGGPRQARRPVRSPGGGSPGAGTPRSSNTKPGR